LTLIVFNHNKNTLKFDLWVIAFVQIAALAYGTWTIHHSRPLAIAYINNSFMTIFANSALGNDIENKIEELQSYELFYSFSEESNDSNLLPQNFQLYATFAHIVKETNSPYINDNLINIDPLVSSKRYIKIDITTGEILGFIKK
jgi:hypothetical protein